jgi:hypothetical protein
VAVATEQIPELQGVDISSEAYRSDLAEAAIADLGDADVNGAGYERREIELTEGGN